MCESKIPQLKSPFRTTPKNADICRVLFSSLPDHYFKCNFCGTIRRRLPSSGYGNLVSHLKDTHDSYVDDYLALASSQAGNLYAHAFVNDKISNIYRWMSWVVDRNMPLSELSSSSSESPQFFPPALRDYVQRLAMLPRAVCGAFAVFWHEGQMHMPLLAIAPLDEFLIGDNYATNQLVATMLAVPLVGCASHRFNLATQAYLTRHSEIIDAVAALTAALRAPNNRRELRHHTNLAPLRANATRWSSTFAMLEGVCKKLPEGDLSMAAVRVLFDRIIEMYPVTKEHLSPDDRIVHSPSFESGVVKVATNRVEALSEDKTTALKPFELQEESAAAPRGGNARRNRQQPREKDFATAVFRNDAPGAPATPRYCEIVARIPSTSNHCERLFSQCKLILTPQQASLLPINFETLSFLHVNRQYWDASTLMALVIDEEQ
ncbi:hypothetical protein PHMEG_0001663 [Phytophthora megakarya]|uniref:BED-type domain-containing protein n=1 Tax=Phytophthora megakarya TaxID=4795 RepID=A0A225X149_9STRA|nr:hypothetical protein PHMEG_0001663 [Phytophthora megakarya]